MGIAVLVLVVCAATLPWLLACAAHSPVVIRSRGRGGMRAVALRALKSRASKMGKAIRRLDERRAELVGGASVVQDGTGGTGREFREETKCVTETQSWRTSMSRGSTSQISRLRNSTPRCF